MVKTILAVLFITSLSIFSNAQNCAITAVNATALPCDGYYFSVSIDLEVSNPPSPGFTLAGNGVIYGTFLYSDLPVTVGPLLGDNFSTYTFIAWDVENGACQNYTTLEASNCGPICSLSNANLELIECVSNISALVVFDMDYENVTAPNFDLYYANGTQVGSWLYESLPVTINFFQVNGAAPIHLTACDHNNPDCCQEFIFPAIDCNPNNCEIVNMSAVPQCVGNNFVVHLDFDYSATPSDSFSVHGNNIFYGDFAYSQLPITLGPLNGNSNIPWEFIVQDQANPNCTNTVVLGVFTCPPPCHILELTADVTECTSDSTYALLLGLEIEGEGDLGYSVFSPDHFYGTHSYDNLPLLLSSFAGSGNLVDQVTVCDNANPGCCATTLYEAFLCAGCVIADMSAIPQPCNDDDQFMVQLDFYHYNVSDQGFEVTGNGNNYGQFSYNDLPILLGPFQGDVSQYLEFVVSDLVDPLCFGTIELGEISCNDICNLSNLQVETGACTGVNTYILHLDLDHQGNSQNFTLTVNGEYYDTYSYTDLPLTLVEFPSAGNGVDHIAICDQDHPDCCISAEFAAPICECHIFDAVVDNLACTSDSTFAIALNFLSENTPNQNVDIYLGDAYWGFYNAENLPLILDNIPDGDGNVLLTVCASDQNACCDQVEISLMSCGPVECHLWDLVAETGDCTSDSTYVLDFTFNHSNLPTDSILVTANGTPIGQYLIHPDFNRIELFPVLPGDTVHLVVCAVGAPDCCDDYTYIAPDCAGFSQCHIWDLGVDLGDCTTDSSYNLFLLFNLSNLPSDSVVVTANGTYYGTYPAGDGLIYLQDFPEFNSAETAISVCALGAPDCCDAVEFNTPDCGESGNCAIWDLVAIAGDCQSDSTYVLHIEFNFANLPVDSVHITANEQDFGNFQVHEGSIWLEHFPEFNNAITYITVCAVGAPDCCATDEFFTPDCGEGTACLIDDLVAESLECIGDSAFVLHLQYNALHLPVDSVTVIVNETNLGTFLNQPDGFNIENVPLFDANHVFVTVCAVDAPDCCDSYEFEMPDCGQGVNCHFDNLIAETGECTSDSTFILDIVFDLQNAGTDSVLVFANDQFVGQYQIDPDYLHIENFPHLDGEVTTLTVCAAGNPDCCASFAFETPFCTDECIIYAIAVETFACTSDTTFGAVIQFQYQNITAGGFDIWAGDQYLGFFTVDQVPVETAHFPANETGQYVVNICESDNTECCASYAFTGPTCGGGDDCHIYDLSYTMTECDSSGHFYFILDFEFDHPGNEGFNIVGNGNNYGSFGYEDVPVTLGPFEPGDTQWEFEASDNQYPDCSDSVIPGVVDCIVATAPVLPEHYFQILNNGTTPAIHALKPLILSLFHANGDPVIRDLSMHPGAYYDLTRLPDGFYITTLRFADHVWPVKLIRAGNR